MSLSPALQCAAGKEKLQRSVLHMREGAAGEQVVGLAFKGERLHASGCATWLHYMCCIQTGYNSLLQPQWPSRIH